MKKLMTIMVAILAFVAANAATIQWATGDLRLLDAPAVGGTYANTWAGQEIYFFLCSSTFDTSEGSAFVKALTATGVIPTAGLTAAFATPPKTPTGMPYSLFFEGDGDFGSATYYGIAVIFDKSGDYVAVSKVANDDVVGNIGATLAFGGPSGFKVYEIIPEPATALLALAGIGLLIAQKRRRT